MAELTTLSVRVKGDVQPFEAAMAKMDRDIDRAADSISKKLGGLDSVFSKVAKAAEGTFSGLGKIGLAGMGISTLVAGISSVAKGMVAGNAEMETYTTQLTTLMGSSDKAKERLAELAKFGAETPFELPEIAKAEKVLLGFGLTGEKAMKMTGKSGTELRTIIGDIAAGTGSASSSGPAAMARAE
ncbi:MAG: hypothetical protein HY329_13835 [Chloroflexi bacterium]|nr:hypothetical protein [Chloroflexota bacterium]